MEEELIRPVIEDRKGIIARRRLLGGIFSLQLDVESSTSVKSGNLKSPQ